MIIKTFFVTFDHKPRKDALEEDMEKKFWASPFCIALFRAFSHFYPFTLDNLNFSIFGS